MRTGPDTRCAACRPLSLPLSCSGYELGKRVAPKNAGLASDLTAALVAQVRAGMHGCSSGSVRCLVARCCADCWA